MRELLSILKFISNHPLAKRNKYVAYKNFFRWQLLQKISPKPRVCRLIENSSLLVEKGMVGATGNIYCGLLEFEDMAFMLHLLRPGDLFGDVGANVGVYTVLAAKNAGASVISIEPLPETFRHLIDNVTLNGIGDLVRLFDCGIAAEKGDLTFTTGLDAVNHVMASDETNNKKTVKIQVQTLDDVFRDASPLLLKIDVEGFEHEVIKGSSKLLKSEMLKAIIIELNGSGMRYGFSDRSVHQQLLDYGFSPYAYEPFSRMLTKLEGYGNFNTIYIRNVDFITERIKTAGKFAVLGLEV